MVNDIKKLKKFGRALKSLRNEKGLTQPELASVSGVTTSIVNDLENGIRTAGSKTVNKIAKGLELNDQDRFRLLLNSLELSKRDFVIPDFENYPPELINFLPFILSKFGITPELIKDVDLHTKQRGAIEITTKQNTKLNLEIKLSQR